MVAFMKLTVASTTGVNGFNTLPDFYLKIKLFVSKVAS